MDKEIVRELAYRAYQAYNPPLDTEVIFNAAGETRGFLSVEDGSVIVAISGTKSEHDWMVDARFRKRRIDLGASRVRHHASGGKVHGGFWAEYQTIAPQISCFIASHPRLLIRCAGHSLGGALAVLAATDAATSARKVDLVTLGCPRTVDGKLAAFIGRLGIHHVRIVHAADVVPHVPIFGFTHTGREYHIDSNGRRVSAPRRLLKKLIAPFHLLRRDLQGAPFRDHFVRNYLLPIDSYFAC